MQNAVPCIGCRDNTEISYPIRIRYMKVHTNIEVPLCEKCLVNDYEKEKMEKIFQVTLGSIKEEKVVGYEPSEMVALEDKE